MEKLLLNAREVAQVLGYKESTIRNWHQGIKNPPPNFPPARKTGADGRGARWFVNDIVEYTSNLPTFKTIIETLDGSHPVSSKSLRGRGRPRKNN